MTYKLAIDQFRLRYRQLCFERKLSPYGFTNREIMLLLSQAQKELGETRDEATADLILVSGQYEYVQGSGTSNIPYDLFNPLSVIRDGDTKPLRRTSMDEVRARQQDVNTTYPTCYTLELTNNGIKFVVDKDSGTLHILYVRKFTLFGDSYVPVGVGAVNEYDFSDYDETKTDYGGSFKLSEQFQPLMVEGALCTVLPELYQFYALKLADTNKPKFINTKSRYKL
jgi:hypothetical protein